MTAGKEKEWITEELASIGIRTISHWINPLIRTGFTIEQLPEPRSDDETVRRQPSLQAAQGVAYFWQIRSRKSSA